MYIHIHVSIRANEAAARSDLRAVSAAGLQGKGWRKQKSVLFTDTGIKFQ